MHPQDIKAGQGAVQLMQNALQNQAQAQDKATQAFDRLSENAFNFAKYFENKQRYQEEKAFREQAYKDEKAYKEQRDKINDERYTKEFDENKRRYDNDYAIKKQVANAQINLYGKQAQGMHYANQRALAQNATDILSLRETTSGDDVAYQTTKNAQNSALIALGGNKALKDAQKRMDEQGVKKVATMDTKIPKSNTNSNLPQDPQNLAKTNNHTPPPARNPFLDK